MRFATISAVLVACSVGCAVAKGDSARISLHPQYRLGAAPRSQFKVGGKTYAISPQAKNTKQIRALKSGEFDPTTRADRVEKFYRTKFKDHYEEFQHDRTHDYGPFRAEFVEWARHWRATDRARWAWHNREYIDGPLWAEWMADPAFAAVVDTLQRQNVPAEAGYLPSEYASVSPVAIYNDEYLNAAYNPVPFLAVLKLKSLKADEGTDWIGTAAADSLVSKLSSVPGVFLADRAQVTGVLRKNSLTKPDAGEPETAAQVGKALDVQQVVVGSYVADGDKVLFNLRIVDVQTGAVQGGISNTLSREHLLDEMPSLATSLAAALGFQPELSGSAPAIADADVHGVDHRIKWINASYNATFRKVGEKKWAEFDNTTGQVLHRWDEIGRKGEWWEFSRSDHEQNIRVSPERMELLKDGDWIWVANGKWSDGPADLHGEERRTKWLNTSYDTTLRPTGGKKWAEFDNKTGRHVLSYEETGQTDKLLELSCPERQQKLRVFAERMELFKDGKWVWVANGRWIDGQAK